MFKYVLYETLYKLCCCTSSVHKFIYKALYMYYLLYFFAVSLLIIGGINNLKTHRY